MAPASAVPAWFSTALVRLAAGDVDGWMDIYAPDAVHEFPWAPPGRVRRLEGRDAISEYMHRAVGAGHLRFGRFDIIRARQAGDELIVEAVGHHHRVADGAPAELHYTWSSPMTAAGSRISSTT